MIKEITKLVGCISLSVLSLLSHAQLFSPYIVVDQFGYTPTATKVAVIRDPQTGYDASESFTPSNKYALINVSTNAAVFTGIPIIWKGGDMDTSSGDKAWWFDFSTYDTPGNYYVKDVTKNVRSAEFVISDTAYKSVLKAAMRMLYYQRSSFIKETPYAGIGWTDAPSHTGALQDKNARLYNNLTIGTEKDLHGAWYDAGDFNKYTAWTSNYVITLLSAYKENPTVFTDDFNIPESGNGIPDIIDEVKWGLDHLLRMQQNDGSCLSVLSSASNSVNKAPSTATGQSKYGPATTNATLKCAEAFAMAAKVYREVDPVKYATYATTLETQAITAWTWADENPSITFDNNSSSNGSSGLAAGNQETNDLGRKTSKLGAALYLYDLTGEAVYLNYFESNYTAMPLVAWYGGLSQYFLESQSLQMYYLSLPGISSTVANNIRSKTLLALNNTTNDFADALKSEVDPYRAFIKDYNWGSNQYKSNYGNLYWELNQYEIDASNNEFYLKASEEYLHYLHGVNPFQLVYLTNMSSYGAEKSANEMYHTWFADGSAKWDRVGTSTYGPPPGFLMGGANNNYKWDNCCNSNCGDPGNTAMCTSMSLTPPRGQHQQKSYKDFNTSWPLNSWQLTETSLGYQTAYIRLLSKFVHNTDLTTGIFSPQNTPSITVKPNPTQDQLSIEFPASVSTSDQIQVDFYNVLGNVVLSKKIQNASSISIGNLENGVYVLKVSQGSLVYTERVVKIQ